MPLEHACSINAALHSEFELVQILENLTLKSIMNR